MRSCRSTQPLESIKSLDRLPSCTLTRYSYIFQRKLPATGMAAADIERILLDLARDTVSSIIDLGSTIYYDPFSEKHSILYKAEHK